jgi:hypothetical protein
MKTLRFSILVLALAALIAAPVAAAELAKLAADLDGDKELETITQAPLKSLYQSIDLEKDGDPDLFRTRGAPVFVCGLDRDAMPEAIIADAELEMPWAADSSGNFARAPMLVFVRGDALACVPPVTDTPDAHAVLWVCDPPYSGEADIDRDGTVDIVWVCD